VAEDLAGRTTELPRLQVSRPSARPARYRSRFLVGYVVLAAILAASAVAFVVLAREPARDDAAWSPWRPTGDEANDPDEIAAYVSGKYQLPTGDPMVTAIASGPQIQNIPISFVTIRGSNEILRTSGTLVYLLCGEGRRCATDQATLSTGRLRALKREGLELALYTFKYVDGIDSVIGLLPPTSNGKPSGALFFRERNFEAQLEQPLEQTLPRPDSVKPARVEPADVLTVERLTTPYFFGYEFRRTQNELVGLVLTRPTS